MKLLVCFTTIIILLFTSCASSSKSQYAQEEVFFDDGFSGNTNAEITFDDNLLTDKSKPNSVSQKIGSTPVSRTDIDGSQITYSIDSYGNQSESRCFNNHLRISCVLLKTSVEGKKTGLVYAQTGKIKNLPAEMFDKIMTASADELANAASVVETKNEFTLSAKTVRQPQNLQPLKPLPSYKFPVQPTSAETPSAEAQTETSADNQITKTRLENNSPEDENN